MEFNFDKFFKDNPDYLKRLIAFRVYNNMDMDETIQTVLERGLD